MNHLVPTGSDPAPLDFNTPRHADSIADASVSQARPRDTSDVPAPDTESLLAEIGLPARAVREILVSSSAPDF